MTLNINKSITEEELIKKCLNNDYKGQRELYNRYSGRMMGVCSRYINDRGEAEGVMVGGFLKIFDRIHQFTGKGSLEAWIRRIPARTRVINK